MYEKNRGHRGRMIVGLKTTYAINEIFLYIIFKEYFMLELYIQN
jgi:hypothetical protein